MLGRRLWQQLIFDHLSICFEGVSFVENVREASKGSLSGLKELQKQVLSDVLNDQIIVVKSVSDGRNKMKRMMGSKRALVVLDDVDDIDQLEALAGSNLLFGKYAFGREIPLQGYEVLSGKVVHYADGLPLTIKVLGSQLCGRNEREWVDALERLKTIPLQEILEKLELSYIGLENDHKEIFLGVAYLLKGMKRKKAIRILVSCGFHAEFGLRVLQQKSLLTISKADRLLLHDHLEEMGRNIVRRLHLHPDEPNKHN
ncbi:disease resistance protein RUN1-like [Helianthus annuus]|uniref:disease resistance protein RUN1-like n=1 Tax=Helianthus annuus TaxID=4232 RepID=UPI000B8F18E9|nr:disease resistance protein RUN1-like [Helianthus annuus]